MPPDPRADKTLSREVEHSAIFKLTKRSSSQPAVLKHLVSGEEYVFPADVEEVALHTHNGYSYVRFVKDAVSETKWVASLMKWSLWIEVATGKQFLFRKHDDGWETRWLSDLEKDCKIHYLTFAF